MKKVQSIYMICIVAAVAFICASASVLFFSPAKVYAQTTEDVSPVRAPETLQELQTADDALLSLWAGLEKFNSYDYDIVTSVKTQAGPICWAYAATAAAETAILREGIDPNINVNNFDLCENNVAWATLNRKEGFDPLGNAAQDLTSAPWASPGSVQIAMLTMAQGRIPIAETNDFEKDGEVKYRLENAYGFNRTDIAGIKEAIVRYGAAMFSFTDKGHGPYSGYFNGNGYTTDDAGGHACVIVGWDDTVRAEAFGEHRPQQDGAWVVKNSWGGYTTQSGLAPGYFYMTYEEESIDSVYALDFCLKKDYKNTYFYDGATGKNGFRNAAREKFAAIYEAKGGNKLKKELLKAVRVYLIGEDITCNVTAYTDLQNANASGIHAEDGFNDPETGENHKTVTMHFNHGGMYSIPFEEEIELLPGTFFSLVVEVHNPAGDACVAAIGDHSSNDMTYYYDGGVWRNNKYNPNNAFQLGNYVLMIKAITTEKDRAVPLGNDVRYAEISLDITALAPVYYCAKPICPEPVVTLFGQTLREGTDYNVSYENNIYAGNAMLKVDGKGGYSGTAIRYFYISKPEYPLNTPPKNMTVSGNVSCVGDVRLPEYWHWLDICKDEKLSYNKTVTATAKYSGPDIGCFQNPMIDIDITYLDQATDRKSLSDFEMRVDGTYIYTGDPITPRITVIDENGYVLVYERDYTLSCYNNTFSGIATAIVTGISEFQGEKTLNFTIEKAANPAPPANTAFTAEPEAEKLEDIPLPEGWAWCEQETVLESGTKTYLAHYVGDDREQYENTEMEFSVTVPKDTNPAEPVEPDSGTQPNDKPGPDKPDDTDTNTESGKENADAGSETPDSESDDFSDGRNNKRTAVIATVVASSIGGISVLGLTVFFILRKRRL